MSNDISDGNKEHSKDLHNFIDTHLRKIRWASYGLGALAVFILLKKVKASKKFNRSAEIPELFIAKNYRLQGHIQNVTQAGVMEMEHTPILELKWLDFILKPSDTGSSYSSRTPVPSVVELPKKKLLKVLPAGLEVNKEGAEWLKTYALGKHAWFTLMARSRNNKFLYCDVKIKKTTMSIRRVSVSKELVREGICGVYAFHSPPEGNSFNKYVHRLIALEHKAVKKGKGMWREENRLKKKFLATADRWITKLKTFFKR